MKKILVTGNIGSGKSSFCKKLKDLGYPVLDADILAREVLFDPEVEKAVKDIFGDDSFLAPGQLNRAAVGKQVFSKPQLRKSLEAILHPKINDEFHRNCDALHKLFPNSWLFYEASLIIEIGGLSQFDASIFVTVNKEERFKRLKENRNMEQEAVERVLKAQMPDVEKGEQCNLIFDNSGNQEQMKVFIWSLPRKLLPILNP